MTSKEMLKKMIVSGEIQKNKLVNIIYKYLNDKGIYDSLITKFKTNEIVECKFEDITDEDANNIFYELIKVVNSSNSSVYIKKYIEENNIKSSIISVFKNVTKIEDKHGINCLFWNDDIMEDFLKSFRSVNPNIISYYISLLKTLVKYIAMEKGVETPSFFENYKLIEYVDFDKLLSTTLSFEQYNSVKKQINLNVRDRLMFQLAWEGLTSDEIRDIKINLIKFTPQNEDGLESVTITTRSKIFTTDNIEIVNDVKECIKENFFYINDKNGIQKKMDYKESKYLIKPVKVGKTKNEDFLASPNLALQKAIITYGVTCEGIEVKRISLETIRRSRIIYLLSPQNSKYFDKKKIMDIYEMGNNISHLIWLEKVALIKYPV